MAKTKKKSSNDGFMTGAAEVIGGALGTIAGTITRLRADHPHPVEEAKEALADARKRTSAVVESTKTAIAKLRKPAARARRKGSKTSRKAKPAAKKTVKPGKKVPRRASKTAARRGR